MPNGAEKALRTPTAQEVWDGIERLVGRTDDLGRLRSHAIELIATQRSLRLGREVPAELLTRGRRLAFFELGVPALLDRVREVYDETLVLFKGPELATYYPPTSRPFSDVDLLTAEPQHAHSTLRRAGFIEVGDPELYIDIHHLRPLAWPNLPVKLEIHRRPKWPDHLLPPQSSDLFRFTEPARCDARFLTFTPEAHVLIVAAHGWAHEPLRILRDIIDIAVLLPHCDLGELELLARAWGLERLWRTTHRTVQATLFNEPRPLSNIVWARHLKTLRERTVLEAHLEQWLSAFSALDAFAATRVSLNALARDLRPTFDEDWRSKAQRTRKAFRGALKPRAAHDLMLGDDARRGSRPPRKTSSKRVAPPPHRDL